MGMFAILTVFCCLALIFLGWRFFNHSVSKQRHQRKGGVSDWATKNQKYPEQNTVLFKPTEPKIPNWDRSTEVVARRVTPKQRISKVKNRLPSSKHQRNIQHSYLLIQQLRAEASLAKLPVVIATLRRLYPYVFEELLLTCCEDQGWQIERSFRYSGDGGVDGRVLIAGFRYLVQAKRYKDYINPQHIEKFRMVIQSEGAAGGFFIHTGKTGTFSKQLLTEFRITLISGQKLVDFVLGRKVRIVGITIPISSDAKADF